MEKLDLTTVEGLKKLDEEFKRWGWVVSPGAWLGRNLVEWLASSQDVTSEKQAEAAERIIEAGKKNGAKKVTFKVSKDVGLKLKGKIPGQFPVDVEAKAGTDNKMELVVEYK